MERNIVVTGATGALGPHLIAELLRSEQIGRIFLLIRTQSRSLQDRFEELQAAVSRLLVEAEATPDRGVDRLVPMSSDITRPRLGLGHDEAKQLSEHAHVIVHAAADTRFGASMEDLHRVNVAGTQHVLSWARGCRRLNQFLFISTTCVAGTQTGTIPEQLSERSPTFVNHYEQTKWHAEQLAASSGLPVRIARLSTCVGGRRSGYVHRFGAIHRALQWFLRGLIPMVPGTDKTPLDLIATDVAAQWLARVATQSVNHAHVCHVAAGQHAVPLRDLLDFVMDQFEAREIEGRRRRIERPLIVDRHTFELFQRSIEQSGDVLFARVLASASSFLPALLHPKVYRTEQAEKCWGGSLPVADWQSMLGKVFDFGYQTSWGRKRSWEPSHA